MSSEDEEWFASLTSAQQFAWRRQRRLDACLRWRRLVKRLDIPVFRDRLRAAQASLVLLRTERVLLRAERVTGIPAGEA